MQTQLILFNLHHCEFCKALYEAIHGKNAEVNYNSELRSRIRLLAIRLRKRILLGRKERRARRRIIKEERKGKRKSCGN